MDPNECLRQLLRIAGHIQCDPTDPDQAAQLAQRIIDLDNWIISGGFLPERWDF